LRRLIRACVLTKELSLFRLATVLLASAFVLAVAAPVYAEGGHSVAGAPAVAFGQQEFGTTANASPLGSFWLMSVTAGDTVLIDWESQGGKSICLNPPGTTDFNIEKVQCVAGQASGANGKNELTYTATGSGVIPIQFFTAPENSPAPYNFTAYVTHVLNVAPLHASALRRAGTLAVAVHNPEGGPISDPSVQVVLQIKGHGGWQTIGTAAVANSVAVVAFKVPARLRHQYVTLRALAQGSNYRPASSAHLKVHTL